MVCHWPGIYFNGTEHGFNVFKTVVERIHRRYDNLIWLKLSEIARYWAAKELTGISASLGDPSDMSFTLHAPFACPEFTVRIPANDSAIPSISGPDNPVKLERVSSALNLKANTWFRDGAELLICFNLQKGNSTVSLR